VPLQAPAGDAASVRAHAGAPSAGAAPGGWWARPAAAASARRRARARAPRACASRRSCPLCTWPSFSARTCARPAPSGRPPTIPQLHASARRPLEPGATWRPRSARTPAHAAAWPLSSRTSMDPTPPAARRFPGWAARVSVTLAGSHRAPTPREARGVCQSAARGDAASIQAAQLTLGAPRSVSQQGWLPRHTSVPNPHNVYARLGPAPHL